MVKRIDKLTDEHRATFPGWVEKWVAIGHRTGLLDQDEWNTVDAAARACYTLSGKPEPGAVVHTPSPLSCAIAAMVARSVTEYAGKKSNTKADYVNTNDVRPVYGADLFREEPLQSHDPSLAGPLPFTGTYIQDFHQQGALGRALTAPNELDEPINIGIGIGVLTGLNLPMDTDLTTYPAWLPEAVKDGLNRAKTDWYNQYDGGNLWCDWEAWASWFVEVGGLELEGDLPQKLQARVDLMHAGPIQWYDNCFISERPLELHVETANDQTRMHNETGPAIAWIDGWKLYFWHGTQVPEDLITQGWSIDQIFAEQNAEIRRCAIEKMGWDRFVDEANLEAIGKPAPDPGNPGQTLALYRVPDNVYDEPVNIFLCTNATAERDGTRHRFGITVPREITDPVEAAAWSFGLERDEYAGLVRAT